MEIVFFIAGALFTVAVISVLRYRVVVEIQIRPGSRGYDKEALADGLVCCSECRDGCSSDCACWCHGKKENQETES